MGIHPTAFEGSLKLKSQPAIENLRLLVVEDESDAREMMRVLLESVGAKVMLVSSVADALEKLENSHFDILISGVEMPDEDGYSLIKRIRRADNAEYSEIGESP